MSLFDFSFSVRYIRWLVEDMCKSKLLLNDMPVFHENLFKIGVAGLLAVTNDKISFAVSFFHIYHSHLLFC